MNKKYRTLLFGAIISITSLLTGCFEFVEKIDLQNNGSGAITATLNMSKSKTKVASLMKLSSFGSFKIPSETTVKAEMEELATTLKNTKGISNVKYTLDFKNYIATLSCNFAHIEALNEFSKALSKKTKVSITSYNSYSFNPSAGVFKRNYTYTSDMGKEFGKLSNDDQQLFNDAIYTNITRFEKSIKTQQHNQAKVSEDKKTSLLRVKAIDLLRNKANLTNNISLIN
ncbi:hypothetical protein ORI89_04310 [Sphingobacterium sp. UT-1RO-CII-1]|uniref:hypothetical protein n=1 Tax=Sphingobacterium sp. UT-1RO-CII-1 TaxID=2995225 RepID=UPI00227B3364|nr:hypothetical protein [Sphingobacterium sp. UT-1RO-CII-1]MCY4778863.1 hypothetical protein [Sphingobacterium sp. UT-1RO-CII-1]